MFRAFFLGVILFGGQSALGIANGQNLNTLLQEAVQQKREGDAALYRRMLSAVGMVAAIDENPIISKNSTKTSTIEYANFKQTQCGAVYFARPATFVASAKCFNGDAGHIDNNRLYAKVFVEGKGWTISPLSIMIPLGYTSEGAVARLDVAIFSLEKDLEEEFSRTHTPIELATPDTWLVPGQRVYFAAHGSQSSKIETFGTPTLKKMTYTPPPAEAQTDRHSPLHIGPEEEVLTYSTEDDSKGINCLFDSGGAAIIEMKEAGKPNRLALIGSIIGRIGADGKPTPCEATNRYAVSTDLRYKHEWIHSARLKIQENREAYLALEKEQAAWRARAYGKKDPYPTFVPTRVGILRELLNRMSALNRHEQTKQLFYFMQEEHKRREARQFLYGDSAAPLQIAATPTRALRPADPWIPMTGGTVLESRRSSNRYRTIFDPANTHDDTTKIRIVNLTDRDLDVGELRLWTWGNDDRKPNTRLKPGVNEFVIANPNLLTSVEMSTLFDQNTVRVFEYHKTAQETANRAAAEARIPTFPVVTAPSIPAWGANIPYNQTVRGPSYDLPLNTPQERINVLTRRRNTSIERDYDRTWVDQNGTRWFYRQVIAD